MKYLYSETIINVANDDAPRFLGALHVTANDPNASVTNVLSKDIKTTKLISIYRDRHRRCKKRNKQVDVIIVLTLSRHTPQWATVFKIITMPVSGIPASA
jgi:hypothetical protein